MNTDTAGAESGPKSPETAAASRASLRAQVRTHAAALPPQQRRIADYLLEHLQEIPFLSVPQLAQRTGASEATVVRFCQRIGYSGFSDLKMALVEVLREELKETSSPALPAPEDAERDPLTAVAQLEQHNIQRTLNQIDRRSFRSVAAVLFKADHIFTFGLGISAYLAELASYLFTEHGLRASCLSTRFSSPREQLVTLRPWDVVLAFSFPPYSKQTLAVLEEANERGLPTVAVTDRVTAPAASLAGQALVVSSHGMTFTNATAAVSVLLTALVVEISSRHQGQAVEALSRINRILSEQTDLIDDVG